MDLRMVFEEYVRPRRIYEVRVAGPVPAPDLLREIGDAELVEQEIRTVLTGRFPDQAALHGFLNRLRALGLEVVEVRRLPADPPHDRLPADPPPDVARGPDSPTATDAAGRYGEPTGPGSAQQQPEPATDHDQQAGKSAGGTVPAPEQRRRYGLAAYEMVIVGAIGPVTRTALQPHVVGPARTYSMVRTGAISGQAVVDLVLRLDRHGCDLDSFFES